MPGSFDSSAARSSIAPTLERQLEWKVEAAGELAHLALGKVRRFFLGLVHSDENQILEHFHILRIGNARIDLDPRDCTLAVSFDGDHAAAGGSSYRLLLQLRLHLLHAR